jgi:signal transduction histidine kinase
VQEGLTNCVRHAQASRLDIDVTREPDANGALRVLLSDDGRGYLAGGPAVGHGIAGMRERVELLGGRFRWLSTPGRGVTIEANFSATGGQSEC